MTLIDIINENVAKNFTETETIKEADLIIFTAQNERFSEAVLITGSIADKWIGYRLDQHNQLRETCNSTIDGNESNYIKIIMYKAKSNEIKNEIIWKKGEPDAEQLRNYFKQ
jgi:hypothetical protein